MHINNGHGGIKKSFKTGMFKAALFCPGHSWYSGGDGPEQGLKEGLHQAGVSALMPDYADRPGRSMLWEIQRELSIKATSKYAIIWKSLYLNRHNNLLIKLQS